jgi:hypothetical protein
MRKLVKASKGWHVAELKPSEASGIGAGGPSLYVGRFVSGCVSAEGISISAPQFILHATV